MEESKNNPTGSQKTPSTGSHDHQTSDAICLQCWDQAKWMRKMVDKLATGMGDFPYRFDIQTQYDGLYRVIHLESDEVIHPYRPKPKTVRKKGRLLPIAKGTRRRQAEG